MKKVFSPTSSCIKNQKTHEIIASALVFFCDTYRKLFYYHVRQTKCIIQFPVEIGLARRFAVVDLYMGRAQRRMLCLFHSTCVESGRIFEKMATNSDHNGSRCSDFDHSWSEYSIIRGSRRRISCFTYHTHLDFIFGILRILFDIGRNDYNVL